MSRVLAATLLILTVLLGLETVLPPPADAHACACRDVNDDGVCDASDIAIDDTEWLRGTAFVDTLHTFLVPAGCSHTLTAAPTGGVRVTAKRVVIGGELVVTPPGGYGVLFTALEDLVMLPGSNVVSGGANSLSTLLPANIAIARAAVGLKAGTTCTLLGASLAGKPITGAPLVGIQCGGDIRIEGSDIMAAGVDIQSLTGRIIGSGASGSSAISLAQRCDDPALNPNGNGNGVLDDGDFPCTVRFEGFEGGTPVGLGEVADFCSPPDFILARNYPLVMASKGDMDLGHPGPGHVLVGAYKVQLYSADGNVDVSNATVANALPPTLPPGGAYIELAANPSGITRYPPLRESVTGPFTGDIDVAGTCFISAQAVRFRGTATGAALPTPCLDGAQATALAPGVAMVCDAQGNHNGVVDAQDFPCTVTFSGPVASATAQAQAFCGEDPGAPDVAISKQDSPDPVLAGGTLTYTITVSNVSGTTANDVVVSDTVPAGTSLVSCVASQGVCTSSGNAVSATIGTLAPAASAIVTLKVTAPATDPCGPIVNVATVSATGDTNLANNTAQATTACNQPPDLAITKVDTPDPVRAGDSLTYTITVTNVGGTPATNAVVTDTIPAGTTYYSCRPSQGTCSRLGSTVTAKLGTINVGASATVTLVVKAPTGAACSAITNVATVSSPGDVNPSNDTAQANTQCIPPDVTITKVDTPDPVMSGGQLTYAITVQNVSAVTASNVIVTDPLPSGTGFVSCVASQGSCANLTTGVRAVIGTMASGASATVTIVVTAPTANPCGPITNVASVTATNDSNVSNNTAQAVTQCTFVAPDVAITKLDTPDPVTPGGQLTYTISVQNVSAVAATNVIVTDPMPSGTGFVSCAASQGTCGNNLGTITASLGTLAPGASATIGLVVTAPTGNPCGPITNVATVSATGDTNTSNNTAMATTACSDPAPPDVAITKVASPDPVTPGGQLTYTITVRNVSTVNASGVTVTDPLPAGTGFVSCVSSQGSCANALGTVTATIGTLAPAASATVTLVVTAPPTQACTTIINTATVSAAGDTNAANNTATAVTTCALACVDGMTEITSNFNGTPIEQGSTVWFNAHVTSLDRTDGRVYAFTGGAITFTANGVPYTLTVPEGRIVFSSAVASASTVFTNGRWETTVPAGAGGDVFVAGLPFTVPAGGLPGGINPVAWSGTMFSNDAGASFNWQWAAAVYTQFATTMTGIGVVPVDNAFGGYQAGTPSSWVAYVTGGARGGGGSNFTGSNSATKGGSACLVNLP